MISLGDDWLLLGLRVYHTCRPERLRLWTGTFLCECGAPVPQRVQSFDRWLRVQEFRGQAQPAATPGKGELASGSGLPLLPIRAPRAS